MSNLIDGILTIGGIEINPNTTLKDIEDAFGKANAEVRRRTNERATLRFSQPVKLGSKNFRISIAFKNEHIWGIDLIVADPSINEWDYKEMLAQHGDWLVEQIGHSAGILSENIYGWGKITQWDDFRSCTAGISIVYFQK
ncbi:hypothetical protein [Bacillus mycoides]|uniref:Uncharacterized protein n=1 Tax=Bacillus mycoides TaxID=1405 RepID=A0AAP8GX93_BACMY|nr:hypothetical protein [Bacillus mycoides]EOO34074.1 hypothetical protein IKK_05760 [Bacillus mycoides]MED1042853.1 hypothetical protein [Bacillus mycoides]OSY00609.1 hypothetical protein S2E19_04564 [Bacillus mycoides]PJN52127.1 hypothetical protein BAWEI_59390 [Bacillus mycoides]PJN69450.1 hypothetical protein BACWE_37280 [Bacillus mycoides]